MATDENPTSFWGSVPGLLTGIAAVITAATGTIAAIMSYRSNPTPTPASTSVRASPAVRPTPPSSIPAYAGHWKRADGNWLLITQQGRSIQYNIKGRLVPLMVQEDGRIVDRKMLSYKTGEVASEADADVIQLSVWSADGNTLSITHFSDYRHPPAGRKPYTTQEHVVYQRVSQ